MALCVGMDLGVVRANHAIPKSLKAYYYEMTIVNPGEPHAAQDDFFAAIGLYRTGLGLEGLPGHNSYAYSGSLGQARQTVNREIIKERFGSPFGAGDTVGCGWRVVYGQVRSIFFTLNGHVLGDAMVNDASLGSQFYPCVWLQYNNTSVRLNFGSQPFVYDFKASLDESYINELAQMSKTSKRSYKRSPEEIKRQSSAEDLSSMCGLPVELCVMALERSSDNIEAAAEWLITSGRQALRGMEQEEQKRKERLKQEQERIRELKAQGIDPAAVDSDNEDDANIREWLLGESAAQASRAGDLNDPRGRSQVVRRVE